MAMPGFIRLRGIAVLGLAAVLIPASDAQAQARVLKDIADGSEANSTPGFPAAAWGGVAFGADVAVDERHVFFWDPSASLTTRITDRAMGHAFTTIRHLTTVGDIVFFQAYDGSSLSEPWRTDGTSAGTWPLRGSEPSVNIISNMRGPLFVEMGGVVYYPCRGSLGRELWRSDGTNAGTWQVADVNPGASGSDPHDLVVLGGELLFVATSAEAGMELHATDGTQAGTRVVKDIVPGPEGSRPFWLVESGGRVYFGSAPSHVATTGEWTYFTTTRGVWAFDCTSATTCLLTTKRPGLAAEERLATWQDGVLYWDYVTVWLARGEDGREQAIAGSRGGAGAFLDLGSGLFMGSCVPVSGIEPRLVDPMPSMPVLIEDIASWTQGSSNPETFMEFRGQICFGAREASYDDGCLWCSDGTEAGTLPVRDARGLPGIAAPSYILGFGGAMMARSNGCWRSDGTVGGTVPLDLPFGGCAGSLVPLGDRAVYSTVDDYLDPSDYSLLVTDGTPHGTVHVADVLLELGDHALLPGDRLACTSWTETGGDPWVTDGTPAGTMMLIGGLWEAYGYCAAGSKAFFGAWRSAEGRELFVTDGTPAGTLLVADIFPGPTGSEPEILGAVGGEVLFEATDGVTGRELWASDGTPGGTRLVKDFMVGPGSSQLQPGLALADRLVFVVWNGSAGVEPWITDGTGPGTAMLLDIGPGSSSSLPQAWAHAGGRLYFSAQDGVNGRELWVTDGTPSGTRLVQDLVPGTTSSDPEAMTLAGTSLYFSADGPLGREPWIMPLDLDGDGVLEEDDNCPGLDNPSQADADGDGFGNPCDSCNGNVDADADNACDSVDNCPLAPNPSQSDLDGDGAGDPCDADADGDGVDASSGDCDDSRPLQSARCPEVESLRLGKAGERIVASWTGLEGVSGPDVRYAFATGVLPIDRWMPFDDARCADFDVEGPTVSLDIEGTRWLLVRAGYGSRSACPPGTFGDSSVLPDPRDFLDGMATCP